MRNLVTRITTTAVLAAGLLVSGFTASASTISLIPSSTSVADNATFYVDVVAANLPLGTSGGGLDLSWTGNMTLNSVLLATTDAGDNLGQYPGNWDPISSGFSGKGTIGSSTLTGLFVGSFFGVDGNQPIARLNFTMGTGVTNAAISVGAAAVGGTWSAWDGVNPAYNFTNTYVGTTINPAAVVPVPAPIWLFGSGLVSLAGVVLRRRRG